MTELSAASLAALRAVDTESQAPANLSDEQAAEVITKAMRALFQPPAVASEVPGSMEVEQTLPTELLTIPSELLSMILSQLETLDLACLAATCRSLWSDGSIPLPQSALPFGLVEAELRRRAEARGLHIDSSLPEGALSWVPYLLNRDFNDAQRREASLAAGLRHSLFVDRKGRLHLGCRRQDIVTGKVGEPLVGHNWDSDADACVSVPPTLLPSMQDERIVSVATGSEHCLALSAVGEVYSWGDDTDGALGHADRSAMAGPRRVEALVRIEFISAGPSASAAVDHRGRLFTWGSAPDWWPYGLGYELENQPTPKKVDALSEHRVVGVALGICFYLAVTDAGVVFTCGHSQHGALGHGLLERGAAPADPSPGGNWAAICHRGCRISSRPRADRYVPRLRLGRCSRQRPRARPAHAAAGGRVGRPARQAGIRAGYVLVRRDGESRALQLGPRWFPTRPRER